MGEQVLTQEMRLAQRLSPLQQQLVRLLEMGAQEMEDVVQRAMDDNPALEQNPDEAALHDSNTTDEEGERFSETSEDLQNNDYTDDDLPSYRTRISNDDPDDEGPQSVVVAEESLVENLMEQISERDLTERQVQIARYIIGNLDEDGYLRRSVTAITDDLLYYGGLEDADDDEVAQVLQEVRTLEPAGVAATDLRDCLLLQLERRSGKVEANRVAYQVVEKFFEQLSKHHYEAITARLNISDEMMQQVLKTIRSLNPKPCNAISGGNSEVHSQQIMPDFRVDINDDDTLTLTLRNNIPELQISESYSALYEHYTAKGARMMPREAQGAADVKRKYEDASTFIKLLKMRQETMFKTMEAIMLHQRNFFLTGDDADLRPMILQDIANEVGRDVSVISRVTSSKYVDTDWGIFPLKHFFTEGLRVESGEEVSSREIQKFLKDLVDGEDKRHPLTDEKLCSLLQEKGYEIARRTIAKYRERLQIPVARLRKEF